MTDINSKATKPIHTIRKVSLQQNPQLNNEQSNISSSFLLSNENILSIKNNYALLPVQPVSSLCKETRHEILLKSSLKLHKNTPTTTKSVRFNMPLVQVLHFHTPHDMEDEYDDEEEDEEEEEGDYYVEEEESDLEDAFLEIFSKGLSSPHDTDSGHLFPQSITNPSLDDRLVLKLTNWPSVHPTKRFISQMVSLESLSWENARSVIKGRVLVHNLAYEKSITVRMSFNHWQTWIDVEATYKESSNGGALDRFTFELVTPNHLSYLNLINNGSHCSMAIRYRVNDTEYWDNNNNKNFNVLWATSGNHCKIGAKAEKKGILTNKHQVISFNSPTPITYNQEDQESKIKKEKYSTCFITTSNTGMYEIPPSNEHDKSNYLSTQQQISAHFQLFLQRTKHHQERQSKYLAGDHDVILSVPSPPLSPLLIPPSRNDFVLT